MLGAITVASENTLDFSVLVCGNPTEQAVFIAVENRSTFNDIHCVFLGMLCV